VIGRVFNLQRFSIHDGPGIRTVVFLKGCPLHCPWCHNPEGASGQAQLSFTPEKCIYCGACVRVCPESAHRLEESGHTLDRERCQVCGRCAAECYAGALERIGRDVSVAEILDEIVRDRPFYEASGGGITLSGGEPLAQLAFTRALLREAKCARLHCCVETSGYADFSAFEVVVDDVDLFLYDLKETDDSRHRAWTGVSNARILGNLRALHDLGASILLRLPIVPGFNDRNDHFERVAELVRGLPNLAGVELMPYHRLGTAKRQRLGAMESAGKPEPVPPSDSTVATWVHTLTALGVAVVNG
jgi:pyruvate formate lyase activating enzyme